MSSELHVIGHRSDAAQPVGLHAIAMQMRVDQGDRALLVGGPRLARHALAAGMTGWRRVPAARPLPMDRYRPLRRALVATAPTAVHCWSSDLLGPINRLLRRSGTQVKHRQLTSDLPMDVSRFQRDRTLIRQSWRATEHTRVIALLSDHPSSGDAYDAALAVGLCREAIQAREPEAQILLLLHPDQSHVGAAHRLFANFGVPDVARQDPRLATPWDALAGCDAALALGPATGLAAAWAVAAGLPLVAEHRPAIDRLLKRHSDATIRLAPPGDLRSLSHQLTQALTEPAPVPSA